MTTVIYEVLEDSIRHLNKLEFQLLGRAARQALRQA